MKKHRSQVSLGTALILATGLALVAMPVAAQTESPPAGSAATVVPPGEEPLGTSYAEWGARWWQWRIGVSDPGDCQAGQSGEVFYLPAPSAFGYATTECTIGADQWILALPGGAYGDNSPPDAGKTPDELLALVEADIPFNSDLAVSIDGEDVADIESYWVVNPGFTIEYAEGNVYSVPAGTYDAAMGGWFVMIPPLEPGSHTITVGNTWDDPADDAGGPMRSELTANVTVEPAG